MTYPRHLFKSPGPHGLAPKTYKIAGAADEDEEAALLEQGWHLTKEAAWGIEAPEADRADNFAASTATEQAASDPFDHDLDGEPGGSKAPEQTVDLKALRAEYAEKMGKNPFAGWSEAELRKRMAAA